MKKSKRETLEEWLYNLLCTINYSGGWCEIHATDQDAYRHAQGKCVEDKWMDILRKGGTLTITDNEDDDEESKDFSLEQFIAAFGDFETECPYSYADLLNENDDFWTAYNYFQVVFFGELIYG